MREKGISLLGAVFTLLILAIFGAAIVVLVSTDQQTRRIHLEKEMAFYESQAGLEYAMREIKYGGYPIVTNKPLYRGSFTTAINYAQHLIFSTGTVGDLNQTHQITMNQMGGDCININNDQATVVGPNKTDIKAITLKKTCNYLITVDKIQLSWDPDGNERVTQIKIENTKVYDDPIGAPSGQVIDIPDYTLSNGNAHQINLLQFTNNMLNKTLTITLYLTDTSYKTLIHHILPPNQK
jgi:hypothetical protein